jgi:hypothetical protein
MKQIVHVLSFESRFENQVDGKVLCKEMLLREDVRQPLLSVLVGFLQLVI